MGRDIINKKLNKKLLFSLLLLVGLILVLNLSTLSAANVTSDSSPPKVTSVNPVNNSIILKSQTIKVNFNEPIKAGIKSITLKNSAGTAIRTKKSISDRTLSIIPTTALPTGVKYTLILYKGSINDLSRNNNSHYSTSFTVSPITLAQMKDGLSRAQLFYNNNLRLPNYVSYGTKKILIAEFQRIIATQGLKINTKIRDLIVTQVTAPTTGVKGNTITVPNTVKNRGNTATGGFYVRYYLISNSSIYIGQRYISSLAAGASNSQNTKLSIPLNITSSSYFVDVYADRTKLVSESNESNNYRYSSTKIKIINNINSRPIYLTSDWIYGKDVDNDKMDKIVSGLKAMGLYAMNYGWGANSHYQILKDITIPQNALVVDIYGGVCAGTIWEMTQNSYKYYKGNRSIFSIWTYTNINIADVTFLRRAYDDNFTPLYGTTIDTSSFPSYNDSNNDGNFYPGAGYVNGIIYPTKLQELDGIYYPAELLLSNGYHYLYQQNGDIAAIVNSIYKEATSNF